MRLVIDANIVISALIAPGGKTDELLFSKHVEPYSPPYLLDELESHQHELWLKTGLGELAFGIALSRILSRIRFVPASDFSALAAQTQSFSPDLDDVPYLALALRLHCPLWTNDKRLKKQGRVRILSTVDLLALLGAAPP